MFPFRICFTWIKYQKIWYLKRLKNIKSGDGILRKSFGNNFVIMKNYQNDPTKIVWVPSSRFKDLQKRKQGRGTPYLAFLIWPTVEGVPPSPHLANPDLGQISEIRMFYTNLRTEHPMSEHPVNTNQTRIPLQLAESIPATAPVGTQTNNTGLDPGAALLNK